MEKVIRTILLLLIRSYQFTLSPFIGGGCRFHPSCSHYAQDALRIHGAYMGTWLTIKRIIRCQPWGGCGIDEVPSKKTD